MRRFPADASPPKRSPDAAEASIQPGFLRYGATIETWVHGPRQRSNTPPPLVVFLHGMCAIPAWECPVFLGAAESGLLLCPPGPGRCQGQGALWSGNGKRLVQQVDDAARSLPAEFVYDSRRRALIGYSLGAFAALRIVSAEPKKWQRLMLVNARATPSKFQLESSGITRLALVAGARDGSAPKLRTLARLLARQGYDARFFSLEQTGHFFDERSQARLTAPLDWLMKGWGGQEPTLSGTP